MPRIVRGIVQGFRVCESGDADEDGSEQNGQDAITQRFAASCGDRC
jgi:hypothetical protein